MTTDNDHPTIDNLGEVPIDVDALIVSKLLASANSGGGKSRMLRRIAEQTWGRAQHIFFDVEGDFHTLRERFPYLLFGPGGDAPLTVEIAAKLILRLLETGANAILDLSELPVLDAKDGGDQRKPFENRARHMMPLAMRNRRTRVAIHNGEGWDDGYAEMVYDLTGKHPAPMPKAIIGVATFTGRVYSSMDPPPADAPGRAWYTGPFAYEIDVKESVVFETAIACRGFHGFWKIPSAVSLKVAEAVRKLGWT